MGVQKRKVARERGEQPAGAALRSEREAFGIEALEGGRDCVGRVVSNKIGD